MTETTSVKQTQITAMSIATNPPMIQMKKNGPLKNPSRLIATTCLRWGT